MEPVFGKHLSTMPNRVDEERVCSYSFCVEHACKTEVEFDYLEEDEADEAEASVQDMERLPGSAEIFYEAIDQQSEICLC